LAGDVMSWPDASAPGKLGHRALRAAIGHEPPDQRARPTKNIAHRATGVGWGIQYGAIAQHHVAAWVRALALGPVAWLSGYIVPPLAQGHKPIWQYDARTLGDDLSAHLVYGSAASATFAARGFHRPWPANPARRRHKDTAHHLDRAAIPTDRRAPDPLCRQGQRSR
jgi:hypothetical protein